MNLIKDWNEFWFALRSARPLAIFRICFGLIVFSWAVSLGPNVLDWFSDQGVFPLSLLHNPVVQVGPRIDLLYYVTSPVLIYSLLVLLMVSSLSLALGFQTRISAIVTWLIITSFHHRNPFVFSSADTLMRMNAFYLVWAPCGRMLSIDRWLQTRRGGDQGVEPEMVEAWGQRLIQIQLCLVYACSFLAKVPGNLWTSGTAIYYPLHMPELLRFPMPFVGESPVLIYLLSMFTLATELGLCTLIWIPTLRRYLLIAGIMLHLGIEYALNIPYFSSVIICTYIVFMPDDWLDRIEAFGRRLLPGQVSAPADTVEPKLNRKERRARA